jgi:hypothetical protein
MFLIFGKAKLCSFQIWNLLSSGARQVKFATETDYIYNYRLCIKVMYVN